MLRRARALMVDAGQGFIADECLSRGASIAFFTLFSLSPLLVIAMAIAGFVFGEDAARGAVRGQLHDLLGPEPAQAIEAAIRGARNGGNGVVAGSMGIVVLLVTATGAFAEIQATLNAIWKAQPREEGSISRVLKARATAVGLVAATGFLLLTSLIASAAITAVGTWIGSFMPGTRMLLQAANALVAFVLLAALFAAIYKVLPDRTIAWRDVAVGAVATAILFTIGKSAIGLYIGGSGIASSFGAAGSLAVVLIWIYYSALIFLFGAELTRAWAGQRGSHRAAPVPAAAERAAGAPGAR